MKKLISAVLLFAMTLSLLAGCTLLPTDYTEGLDSAKKYLISYFQDASETTDTDYTVIGKIPVDDVDYTVTWVSDNENIKVVPQENGLVLIDVPELGAEAVTYTLTATITAPDGTTVDYSITRKISASANVGKTDEQIVEDAYNLADSKENADAATIEGATLTGVITKIKTPYDAGYKTLTVVIQIGNLKDKLIECYHVGGDQNIGEAVKDLAPGDTITVTGTLKNYGGTIEFAEGCLVTKIVEGPVVQCPATPAEILAAAEALENDRSLPYKATLTGVVTKIDTEYDSKYMNLSVYVKVGEKEFLCYRLFGELGATLKAGDTITVTGYLLKYKNKVQFGQGCTLDALVPGEGGTDDEPVAPKTEVVDAPAVDTAYKFGMVQGNLQNKIYYLLGGMSEHYMSTTDNAALALDVYLEATEGGYYLYCYVDEVKTYINMVVSGTYVNGAYEATASTVYTYDATSKTLKAPITVGDKAAADYWFGTRNDKTYTTVGPCAVSYNGFYCQFYAVSENENPGTGEDPENPGTGEDPSTPAADSLLTIEQANTLGLAQASGSYTANSYYVEGIVKEVKNTMYGNIYIQDENGKTFYLYGLYTEGGKTSGTRYDKMTTRPVAGDKIKVYGPVGQYEGTAQIASAVLISTEVLHTCSFSNATCTVAPTCACGITNGTALGHADADFDHACDNGCTVVQGTHADANGDTVCDYGCSVPISAGAKTEYTASKSLNDLATAAGFATTNGTIIKDAVLNLDDNISVVCAQGNAGTPPTLYYGAVRLYQNGATMTVKAGVGATIKTIILTLDSNASGKGPISVSNGTASALTNDKYTITVDAGATEVVITTTGTTSSTRVYVANIEVVYEK